MAGKFDESGARARRRRLRQDPPARAQAPRPVDGGTQRRTASASSGSAARATCSSWPSPTRCPRACTPTATGSRTPTSSSPTRPRAAMHKALVETGKAAQVYSDPADRRGHWPAHFGASVKKGDPVEPVRGRAQPHHRGLRRRGRPPPRRLRARASLREPVREDARQHTSPSSPALRVHRAGRLAAFLSCSRERPSEGRRGGDRKGRQGYYPAATTAPSASTSPRTIRSAPRSVRRPRWRR